jgi:hypothetical protein
MLIQTPFDVTSMANIPFTNLICQNIYCKHFIALLRLGGS